jgi:ketosteroid isomerase-like protein
MNIVSDAVENTIRKLNECWLRGDYAGLARLFHEDAVLLPPGAEQPIVGCDAIIDGYRRFGEMGDIHEFEIVAMQTYLFTGIAMCHMRFNIDYAINERRFKETGTEIYALSGAGDDWKIVWRTQVSNRQD